MKKRALQSEANNGAPSKKRKKNSSTTITSLQSLSNQNYLIEMKDLPAFLYYVAKIMSQNPKCHEVTKKTALMIAAAWKKNILPHPKRKLKYQKLVDKSSDSHQLLCPAGWKNLSKNNSKSDFMWLTPSKVPLDSKKKVLEWFSSTATTSYTSFTSSSSSSSSSSTAKPPSPPKSTRTTTTAASLDKIWPGIQIFHHTFSCSTLPLGLTLHQKKRAFHMDPTRGLWCPQVHVESIAKGSPAHDLVLLHMKRNHHSSDPPSCVVQPGDQVVAIGGRVLTRRPDGPQGQSRSCGTKKAEYYFRQALRDSQREQREHVEFVFGRMPPDVVVRKLENQKKSTLQQKTKKKKNMGTTKTKPVVEEELLAMEEMAEDDVSPSPMSPSMFASWSHTDSIQKMTKAVIPKKNEEQHRDVYNKMLRVFRSWGVEIVGDLCLLHGHQLVGSLRRTMEELLGEDDAKICYQFLEPMIEIATELLT